MRKNKIFKRTLSFLLVVSICLCTTSCLQMHGANNYVTEDELAGILNKENLVGSQTGNTAQGGDNYNITIEQTESSNVASAAKALLSSVSITCSFTVRKGYTTQSATSHGSGVIYDIDKTRGDAVIITNYHVVYEASANTSNRISDDITVNLYGMEDAAYGIPATYVGGSMNYDLAVLKVEDSRVISESVASAAVFADSDKVSVLDVVVAVGNAAGEGISATVGHVNVDSENIAITMGSTTSAKEIMLRVMRIDAAVNSGNSGGGLFDAEGNLVGIVNAKMAGSSFDNIGYAIPSNVVKYITENVLYYCLGSEKENVYRCLIGITVGCSDMYVEYDTENGKVYKRETVTVANVENSGIAKGKLQKGDIINSITIDGETYAVTRKHHVVDVMLNARVGSSVELNVTRDGSPLDVSIAITEGCVTQW